MQLLCLGLNHTTAPLSVRERVAFGAEERQAPIPIRSGTGEGGVRGSGVQGSGEGPHRGRVRLLLRQPGSAGDPLFGSAYG